MDIKEFILKNVEKHPRDVVAVTMKHFKITRPAVHEHLDKLLKGGKVRKEGQRRGAKYFLVLGKTWKYDLSPALQEDQIWTETIKPEAKKYPENVISIMRYGATEMINNAIDHSEGTHVTIHFEEKDSTIIVWVCDDGVGIYNKIAKSKHLIDPREALLQLSKGKLTTDPSNHSGEGIFFTSRAFDKYSIISDELTYLRTNREQDWFIETRMNSIDKGTCIRMEIDKNSNRVLEEVFAAYVDPETHKFDKTNLFVKLSRLEEEQYISRSQAKRLLTGVEKFKKLLLDFRDVKTVGQAFVDEVFRVFKNQHPEIEIDYMNANSDVEFMLKRGIATAEG